MEMNQELAQKLFTEGAVCICLGVPNGTEFGIDLKSWRTAENFRGIKMIPPGIHFIHFNARNSHGDTSPKVGFMHDFKKSEILIKKWDSEKQELIDDKGVAENCFTANLKNMDRFLGAYPFQLYSKWKNLSNKITPNLLAKTLPTCGLIHSALELSALTNDKVQETHPEPGSASSTTKRKHIRNFLFGEDLCEDLLPHLRAVEGTELRFSIIPETWYPDGSSPSEVTHHSMDSSYLLEQILKQHECKTDILGELQFAFLCFYVGYSLEAFDHWRKLLNIFCSCEDAVVKYKDLYSDFLSVLSYELNEIQEDFLVDIVAGKNFVYMLLRKLFRTLHILNISGRLRSRAERFQELLTEKFMWDFRDMLEEDEEDQPVIVEI